MLCCCGVTGGADSGMPAVVWCGEGALGGRVQVAPPTILHLGPWNIPCLDNKQTNSRMIYAYSAVVPEVDYFNFDFDFDFVC